MACHAAMELNIVTEPEETSIEKDQEALVHRPIDGWNKLDKLAAYLTDSEGLSITNVEAETVIRLYEEMLQFDKSSLTYSRLIQPARGRFVRSKNEGGHVGLEAKSAVLFQEVSLLFRHPRVLSLKPFVLCY